MRSLSKCHEAMAARNTAVAMASINTLDCAGLRLLRTLWTMTHAHPLATASSAMRMAHGVALANQPITPPDMAATAAGSANGSTQHTPQASAPVAASAADVPTTRS